MEVLEHMTLKNILSDSLEKSMSYSEYRDLVSELTANNSTTGPEKTDALINYTMLNDRRMKRWDKTVKVSDEAKEVFENSNRKMTWVVLTESWCGDAAHLMPVINKVAELNDNIDYKVVLRDENEALMNQFLTNGGKAIPKLIMIDNETNEVVNTFGPRPSTATNLVNDFKAQHGGLTPEFKEDLQRWYNKDKGQTTIEDFVALLS
ncbi:MAG: thioredoxin family protein [Winogradskyella sp.]|uniref:thioredoxin family protein n=1 Tax=Winogradskyella sp. TaxID=1883156 RepID=UPI000F41BC8D|nr:thioredoxin family protein [Winogradskyella sp.]RNC87806.1 MAG: thioredoxin family protein [Winogradskyella sp.]